jgi:putative oxidoreductase
MAASWMKSLHSDDAARLLLRASVGGLMLLHGIDKLRHGLGGIKGLLASNGLPEALAYGAYVGEVLAPVLVLIGWFTRPAALVIAIQMIMAVYLAHRADVFALNEHGGYALELNVLYLAGALAIVFTGAGRFSVSRGKGGWD